MGCWAKERLAARRSPAAFSCVFSEHSKFLILFLGVIMMVGRSRRLFGRFLSLFCCRSLLVGVPAGGSKEEEVAAAAGGTDGGVVAGGGRGWWWTEEVDHDGGLPSSSSDAAGGGEEAQ